MRRGSVSSLPLPLAANINMSDSESKSDSSIRNHFWKMVFTVLAGVLPTILLFYLGFKNSETTAPNPQDQHFTTPAKPNPTVNKTANNTTKPPDKALVEDKKSSTSGGARKYLQD